jgi:hypothetical protein
MGSTLTVDIFISVDGGPARRDYRGHGAADRGGLARLKSGSPLGCR